MTIRDALARVRVVRVSGAGRSGVVLSSGGSSGWTVGGDDSLLSSGPSVPPGVRRAAESLARGIGAEVELLEGEAGSGSPAFPISGVLRVVHGRADPDSVFFQIKEDGSGILSARPAGLLLPFITHLLREMGGKELEGVRGGRTFPVAFPWLRSTFDFFLTQEGRIQKGLDRESYVRRLAEAGFTHVEVNGLHTPMGIETGPPGEAYPMFYTYCPALDQFVESDLGVGLYPPEYLAANRAFLKRNAELALAHGLTPGLLCFEPRSVPEAFFQRYPMLRGARVDHPFRSFKPRYNMTIAHPLVREHYAQMVRRLLEEVPELGYLSVWTNDSGAGFEHTQSLYVGRNGGPYLIREWKNQEQIARAAGENALRFFRTLRDAGRAVNPDFRVLTRMESFYGEHEVIWAGLGDGLEVETSSLATRGWEMPYDHPRYPGTRDFPGGSVYQQGFSDEEGRLALELEERGSSAHFYVATGPWVLFSPLVGIPYPALTHKRLRLLREGGVRRLAHMGGTVPPELAPFNVNHEVLRAFQFDPEMELAAFLAALSERWAGEELGPVLREAWEEAEEAILSFPHVSGLYSTYGFVWYRLWARPLVPNIEAIPLEERAYYQDFMCTTPHNPNNVDLSRDVLFQLATVPGAERVVEAMDAHVWAPLDGAIALLAGSLEEARQALGDGNVILDQWVRLRALRCWLMTQRNVAAWIAGVCGYLAAESDEERRRTRSLVRDLMEREEENSRDLLALLDERVPFMATTDQGENPLIHGENLAELLRRRLALMEAHRDDEPFIDPEYMERQAGRPA